jgi:trk system potassium uptake protein TrkA
MRVLVVGTGKLGRRVVAYIRDRHDVVVVEQDEQRCRSIEDEFGITVVHGDGDEPSILLQAGADRADVLVATTGHDEDNLVAALLAKNEFKIKKVIAACRNPRNRWLFNRSWGVDVVVDSAQIVARLIEEEATLSDVVTLLKLREGEFSVTAVRISKESGLVGKRIVDLNLPDGCHAAAVLRGSEVIQPMSLSPLETGDELLLILRQGSSCSIESLRSGPAGGGDERFGEEYDE